MSDYLSECCGAEPHEWFDLNFDIFNSVSGLCGNCKEHCDFEYEEEDNE